MAWLLLIPVLLPIVAGLGLLILNFKERMQRQIYVASVIIVNAALSIIFMFTVPAQKFTFVYFTEKINLTLRVDGMSTVFGMIVSILWIVATFYSFEYMKHEGKENKYQWIKRTSFSRCCTFTLCSMDSYESTVPFCQ